MTKEDKTMLQILSFLQITLLVLENHYNPVNIDVATMSDIPLY